MKKESQWREAGYAILRLLLFPLYLLVGVFAVIATNRMFASDKRARLRVARKYPQHQKLFNELARVDRDLAESSRIRSIASEAGDAQISLGAERGSSDLLAQRKSLLMRIRNLGIPEEDVSIFQ